MLTELLVVFAKRKFLARVLFIPIVVAGIVNVTLAFAGLISLAYESYNLIL